VSPRTRWYLWKVSPAVPFVVFAVVIAGRGNWPAAIIAVGAVVTTCIQVMTQAVAFRSGYWRGRLDEMRGYLPDDYEAPNVWDPWPEDVDRDDRTRRP